MSVSYEEQFRSIEKFMGKVVEGETAISRMDPPVLIAEQRLRSASTEARRQQVADAAGISLQTLEALLETGTAGPSMALLERMVWAGLAISGLAKPVNLDQLAHEAVACRDRMVARLKVINVLAAELANPQEQ